MKPIGRKWILTKRELKGDVERYKVHLVAKGFTQKDEINFKGNFSPIFNERLF